VQNGGRRLGRAPLDVDRVAIVRERVSGMSLTQVAKRHRVSRATVVRLVREANQREIIVAA
jgi:transposase